VISRRNAGHWKTALDRLALKAINRLADAWQCNSRASFDSLVEEAVPADRIEILPNAIDLERFPVLRPEGRLAARQALGLPQGAPVFVSVATLFPVKNPMVLVEAAGRVRQALPDAQFLLVGEGPLRASLMDRIQELGLTGTVRLAGAQSDVRPYLAAADIGLLTSRSEGSSNSVLEYMAVGLPTVVSDLPANRALVNGVFCEAGDPRDLADRILDLWNDRETRAQMQSEHPTRAMEYSLEAFVRRAQSYYAMLAARFLSARR
jgi:glycosyltransferase involved in cell wall biosynthesis